MLKKMEEIKIPNCKIVLSRLKTRQQRFFAWQTKKNAEKKHRKEERRIGKRKSKSEKGRGKKEREGW